MTSSPKRVKRREGAKPTLKPVSLLLPVFPTHTSFLRNVEEVMSYEPYHLEVLLWLFFPSKNSCHLGKRTQLKH